MSTRQEIKDWINVDYEDIEYHVISMNKCGALSIITTAENFQSFIDDLRYTLRALEEEK